MDKGIVVVKVGTAVLSRQAISGKKRNGRLEAVFIKQLARQVCVVKNMGFKVILVSSGAIGSGMEAIGLSKRPHELSRLQACAAIGQGKLMKLYEESFRYYGVHAGQILLTRDDFSSRKRILTAKSAIMSLLDDFNAIPVINENDTIATEEIKFGDNDRLSALVAKFTQAKALIILTNVDGLYNPDTKGVVGVVRKIGNDIRKMAQPEISPLGKGGMISKIEAAGIVTRAGIKCQITNGRIENVLIDIITDKNPLGTLFLPEKNRKKK